MCEQDTRSQTGELAKIAQPDSQHHRPSAWHLHLQESFQLPRTGQPDDGWRDDLIRQAGDSVGGGGKHRHLAILELEVAAKTQHAATGRILRGGDHARLPRSQICRIRQRAITAERHAEIVAGVEVRRDDCAIGQRHYFAALRLGEALRHANASRTQRRDRACRCRCPGAAIFLTDIFIGPHFDKSDWGAVDDSCSDWFSLDHVYTLNGMLLTVPSARVNGIFLSLVSGIGLDVPSAKKNGIVPTAAACAEIVPSGAIVMLSPALTPPSLVVVAAGNV
nr:MAG TPA: hypothetical protein [Caudoviricetes sp.]